jgi:hypothetical protein
MGTDRTVLSFEEVMNSEPFLGFQHPEVSSATWPLHEINYRGGERTGSAFSRSAEVFKATRQAHEVCFMSRMYGSPFM